MLSEQYKFLSIEPSEAPPDLEGENWYCYTIGQGENRITGYRQGNLRAIRKSIDELVGVLNDRRVGNRGRTHLRL